MNSNLSATASGSGSGTVTAHLLRPLTNPAQGSAYPAASLPSLWNYLEPALHHILRSPSNNTTGKAPAVDVAYHVGIHTAVYNYFTSTQAHDTVPAAANGKGRDLVASGTDLYEQLDRYLADIAKETLLGAPHDDATLIAYYVPCFNRYAAGVKSIDRLLNYVNRHYVKRSVDEDRGWLRLTDVLDTVAKSIMDGDTREKISSRLREKRRNELRKWGYEDGGNVESLAAAEACAEAASPLDRIVPVSSLGLRRWRTEVIEPLLSVPKLKGKRKGKVASPAPNTDKGPKGRLARAVKDLLEGPNARDPASIALAESLANSLRTCGIRMDHPLRKKLDKFIASKTGG